MMTIAQPSDMPRARMHKPGTNLSDFIRGATYINAKLAAGWEILPDPQNRLLPEWIKPTAIADTPRQRRPRTKKTDADLLPDT
jgi:hypothetical protein